MKSRVLLLACLLVAVFAVTGLAAKKKIVSPGDFFPDYRFTARMSNADAAYLGLPDAVRDKGEFGVLDVNVDLLVLELFNRFCYGCQQQAPLVNQLYEKVAADPALAKRVRFLGVGVGNNLETVGDYMKEFKVPFPIVADPRFEIFKAVGNPGGTPYSFLIRKTPTGRLVMRAHFGVMDSPEASLKEIRAVLAEDVETLLATAAPPVVAPWAEKELKPDLTEQQVMDRVQASMARAGFGQVGLYKLKTSSGETLWVGEGKGMKVYSRIISRLPVCDVCHPSHFILTFDAAGRVADFDVISVTKYWNVQWNPDEVAQMRKRLAGMSILEKHDFDPRVDAVSTATISSSLIFDSLDETGEVYQLLKKEGYL